MASSSPPPSDLPPAIPRTPNFHTRLQLASLERFTSLSTLLATCLAQDRATRTEIDSLYDEEDTIREACESSRASVLLPTPTSVPALDEWQAVDPEADPTVERARIEARLELQRETLLLVEEYRYELQTHLDRHSTHNELAQHTADRIKGINGRVDELCDEADEYLEEAEELEEKVEMEILMLVILSRGV